MTSSVIDNASATSSAHGQQNIPSTHQFQNLPATDPSSIQDSANTVTDGVLIDISETGDETTAKNKEDARN